MDTFPWRESTEPYIAECKAAALACKAGTLNAEKRTVDVVMTSRQVDRDNEIVEPRSFEKRLDTFKANPVVLWNHDPISEPPIGTVDPDSIKVSDDDVTGTVRFRPKGRHELADKVWDAVEDGVLSTVSIGFRVFNIDDEKDAESGEPTGTRIIKDAELFELSFVPIPSNTSATVKRFQSHLELVEKARWSNGEVDVRYVPPTDLQVLQRAVKLTKQFQDAIAKGEHVPDEILNWIKAFRLDALTVKSAFRESELAGEDESAVDAALDQLLEDLEDL